VSLFQLMSKKRAFIMVAALAAIVLVYKIALED
jgi:hypothetical protein